MQCSFCDKHAISQLKVENKNFRLDDPLLDHSLNFLCCEFHREQFFVYINFLVNTEEMVSKNDI